MKEVQRKHSEDLAEIKAIVSTEREKRIRLERSFAGVKGLQEELKLAVDDLRRSLKEVADAGHTERRDLRKEVQRRQD
eukprot:353449-Rhodomonas_salina.3